VSAAVGSPVRGLARRVLQRQRDHALGHFGAEWRNARGARLVTSRGFALGVWAYATSSRLPGQAGH
jgi:hypothetical protein